MPYTPTVLVLFYLLQVLHICCVHRCSIKCNLVNFCDITSTLIVLNKYSQAANILELDIFQRCRFILYQMIRGEIKSVTWWIIIHIAETHMLFVGEEFYRFGAIFLGAFEERGMQFDHLHEGDVDQQLLVRIAGKVQPLVFP